jgi:arylsulfatase
VSNTPFRRHKNTNFEGGIASPLIAWWPGVIRQAGAISLKVSHITDITATCLDAVGVEYPAGFNGRDVLPLEGKSLLPVLKGGRHDGHQTLCWATSGCRAIRAGQWKLVADKGEPWELYDLATDRAEMQNLAGKSPGLVSELNAQWQQWADRCGVKP